MIGSNGDGDVLLTWIRTSTNLYKLQMKAVIANEESLYAYKVLTNTSEEDTSTMLAEESEGLHNQGEQRNIKTPQKNTIELWHHKFCHINTHALRQTKHAVHGMVIQDNKTTNFFCEGCILGKQQRSTYPQIQEKERDTVPGTFFHIDLCGPMSTTSLGGASYFMLCEDNNTGYMVIYILKTKSEALAYLKQLYSLMKQELQTYIQRIKNRPGGDLKVLSLQNIHKKEALYMSLQQPIHPNKIDLSSAAIEPL